MTTNKRGIELIRDPSLNGQAVADQVPSELLNQGLRYPLQSRILETGNQTAARVAKPVFDRDLPVLSVPVTWLRLFVSMSTSQNTNSNHRH